MAIMKRITAQVGQRVMDPGGRRVAALASSHGWVCATCHRQAELVLQGGSLVCSLCGAKPRP